MKFLSLFPTEEIKNEAILAKRDFIRRKISEMRAAGLLMDSKKLLRWRDLSTREQSVEPEDGEEEDSDGEAEDPNGLILLVPFSSSDDHK